MRVLRWPGRGVRGRKRFHYLPTYVPASRQLSRLWIDFTNYLAICRAWVQFFLQWDAWVGNLEGMGYWTLQEKCLWSYWKMGKGGKRDLYGIGKVKRGRATIMLMWPSSQRMDWKHLILTYGDPAHSILSFIPCCVQHVCNFFPESKLSPCLHAMHAILI